MIVSTLMTHPVQKIHDNATAQDAVKKMSRERVGSLIITRNGEDIGIITERDIISKIIAKQGDLATIRVKDIMSTPLVTVDKHTTSEDALRTMASNRVRRLPITDNGAIIGMFTTSDVIKAVPPTTV